jgi:hypothetical protein
MVEAVPPEVVGRAVNLLVRGAPEIGANGLLRFYLLHVIGLPLVGIVALGVHYYKVVLHGHSLPPGAEEVGVDTAKRVPMDRRTYFMPQILTRELMYVAVLVALLVGAAAFFYHAPLEPHADSLVTPLHTTAPWYFLWVQGMLKLGDKVLWGLIVPGVLSGLLLVLPYLEVGPSRRYADRRIGLSIGALSVAGIAILSYMGTPWFAVQTSADQEAIAELVPQTHPGPLRLAPWDDLVVGTYDASQWQNAPNETMRDLLHTFEEAVALVEGPDRHEPDGVVVIEDWQTGLKKITLRVLWTEASTGQPGENSQSVYLHRDSNYGQGE